MCVCVHVCVCVCVCCPAAVRRYGLCLCVSLVVVAVGGEEVGFWEGLGVYDLFKLYPKPYWGTGGILF